MLKCYTVTYDLLKLGQNYEALYERLRILKALKLEYSQWLLWSSASALNVANDLLRFMDANDRILVTQIGANTAWRNLMVSTETMKKIIPAA